MAELLQKRGAGESVSAVPAAAALEESLQQLQAVKPPREVFAQEALQLIAKAAKVDHAVLTACDQRASSVRLITSYGAEMDVFKPLAAQSGRWVTLRCLNEKKPNIVQAAENNPFVPQNMVGVLSKNGTLSIASLPFFHANGTPAGAVILFATSHKHFNDALLQTLEQAVRMCVQAVPEPASTSALPTLPGSDALMRQRPQQAGPAFLRTPGVRPSVQAPPVPVAAPGDGGTAARLLQEERKRVALLERELNQLREVNERFPQLQAEVARLNAQAMEARQAAELARAQAAQLEAARAEADARARAAAATLEALMASRDDLQLRLEESIAIGRQRTQELQAIEAEASAGYSVEAGRVEELRQALIVSEAARVALEAQLNQVREQLTAAQAAHLETQAALQQRSDALNRAQSEVNRLSSRLAEIETQAHKAQADQEALATLRRQYEATRTEARALQSALDAARDTLAAKVREDAQTSAAFAERMRAVEEDRNRAQESYLRLKCEHQDMVAELRGQIEVIHRERDQLLRQLAELQEVEKDRDRLKARVVELEHKLPPRQTAQQQSAHRGETVSMESELERELLLAFSEEAAESLQACEQLLMMLERQPGDHGLISALFRRFHTLKGASAAVGLDQVAAQLHDGESLLQTLDEVKQAADPRIVDFLLRLTDSVSGLIKEALGQDGKSHKIIRDVGAELARLCVRSDGSQPVAEAGGGATTAIAEDAELNVIRVDPARLDEMVDKLGQFDSLRARLFKELRALGQVRDGLLEGHVSEHVPELSKTIDTLTDVAAQFAAVRTTIERKLTQLKLVPLDSLFRRLQRAVRDAARQAGKAVEFEVTGGDVHVERPFVQGLHSALIHIVRNSVAHGIEPPALREERGKSRTGTVHVEASVKNDRVEICVIDDGGGVDFEKVLRKGRERGLIPHDVTPDRNELLQLIFHPGFSTGDSVNELSGRGVGMDVVARELAAMGGRVEVETDPCGTTVRLILPSETVVH